MSHVLNLHDGTGVIAEYPGYGNIIVFGTGAPTASAAGYALNCLWINLAGSTTTTRLYINTGTNTSATWSTFTASA